MDKPIKSTHSHGRQRGAEIVEFLITLPVILIVAAIVYDFGTLLSDQVILTDAARAAAREVISRPAAETDAQVTAAAQQAANQVTQSLLSDGTTTLPTVTVVRAGSAPGTPVTVTVNHAFPFRLLPGFASTAGSFNTSATASMRMLPN